MVSELSQFLPSAATTTTTTPDQGDEEAFLSLLTCDRRRTELLQQPGFARRSLAWLLESEAETPVMIAVDRYLHGTTLLLFCLCLSEEHKVNYN